ncbi:inner membrane complex protein 1k, putative [Plasmodium ovale]|uniref:Inner membrane complex protein 1k, putative n=1 Tax=Plasmodium ovale TaxID=36330 RepID=A0A1D3TKE9_PLAOA|nr:inner membrane complex protein 1k, putative [Plasmodium ovale]
MDLNSDANYSPDMDENNVSERNESENEYYEDENVETNEQGVDQNLIPEEEYEDNRSNQNAQGAEYAGAQYIPDLHGLGRERQALPCRVHALKIPGQVSPYHAPHDEAFSDTGTLYDENGLPISSSSKDSKTEKKLWSWTNDGKLKLQCSQPIIPVSVVQGILRRDKIILIPQVEVTDFVIPKVYNQNIKHDVPKLDIKVKCSNVEIPNVKYVDKEIIIPIITGYTHKFVPKWEVHEVPRPIVKYIGEQKIVEVEVPEIKYVDKIVEREVIVDTVEKRVPKIIEIPKYVDEVQYVWKPIEKIVYIQKLVPKFDVNLECPPPLIVPYPVQTIKQIPPVMVKKDTKIPEYTYTDLNLPEGYLPIPNEYVTHYTKKQSSPKGFFSNCCEGNIENVEGHNEYCDMSPNLFEKHPQEASLENEINICSDSNLFVNSNPDSYLSKREHLPVGVNV